MTRDQIVALANSSLDVGAHTVMHPILANISAAEASREIRQSKLDLEQLTQRPVPLFAYPNGCPAIDYTGEHVRMVRDAGFLAAATTAAGAASRKSDRLQLPRFTPWTRQPLKFDLLMLRNFLEGREQTAGAAPNRASISATRTPSSEG